jgi:hypothetical protein
MRIPKITPSNRVRKIIKKESFQILEKQISKLQDEVLNIEVSTIKAIYGIKVDKSDYKKYKLG